MSHWSQNCPGTVTQQSCLSLLNTWSPGESWEDRCAFVLSWSTLPGQLCPSRSQAWTRLVNWVDRSHARGHAHFTQDCPQSVNCAKVQNLQLENVHMACVHADMYTHMHIPLHLHQFIKAQEFSWLPSDSTSYHTQGSLHPQASFPHLLLPFWPEETWFLLSTIHVFISSIPECT